MFKTVANPDTVRRGPKRRQTGSGIAFSGTLCPRYSGYIDFQDWAGVPIHRFLREGGNARQVMEELRQIFEQSIDHER